MKKVSSVADIEEIKARVRPLLYVREDLDRARIKQAPQIDILVCRGTGCTAAGAGEIEKALRDEIERRRLAIKINTVKTGCRGFCEKGPNVVITPGDVLYTEVKVSDVSEIVEVHLLNGGIVDRLLYKDPLTGKAIPASHEIEFYAKQRREVMYLNGLIDPWNIEEYIAYDGYRGLAKALLEMKPEQVLEEVKKSGIRGRGGAGFATGTKWTFVRNAAGDEKFVLCNGDEGDPGAFMNRSVLEGNAHSVIEGMAIGAYTIGNVRQGYAYVRAEYPLAIETLRNAIRQAEEYGFLGENILGTGFSFSINIFPGAGAFVCGEETALMRSLEGKRGMPRQRPPFPANKGLFDKPTTLNNVETWSNIPRIVLNGGDRYSSIGTTGNSGTKTFCLVGKINNSGIAEVPLGTPMREVIFDIGGGCGGGKKFKAVQIGGPSGGVIPYSHIDTPLDYESVTKLGAIMGSGGLIVMDEDNCMVDMAKFYLGFTQDESCGKCTTCRAGIPKLREILNRISEGKGEIGDIDLLTELGKMVAEVSLCGLGQTAPNPVLSTLRHFREEYEAHIIDKKCPAAVCQGLFRAPCQHTCPVELDVPGYVSLIKEGKILEAYCLIKQRNPFPLVCGRVCHHPCESKCRRGQVDEPVAIRTLKRFAADQAFEMGAEYIPKVKEKRKERVAIIGAGPAGLSAAWDLALEGYQVTVFEALPVAGGMLAVGIPEYRLPKDVLRREVEAITRLGVDIRLNTRINDIASLQKDGYQAVFVAAGAQRGEKMGIPGEELGGVHDAIDFLREVNLGKEFAVGNRVAVVGGGNSAIDAARVALRKGAKTVTILYRREKKDMPAEAEEIESAEEEGIQLHCLTAPTKILSKDGKVSGLECIRMELKEYDQSGRRTPYPLKGSEYTVEVDTVIEAIGQRPDTSFIKGEEIKTGKGGTIAADRRTLATDRKGVFAGGDVMTGPKTVVEAIAAGQRAASSIKRYLQGKELLPRVERDGYKPIALSSIPPTEEETKEKARVRDAQIDMSTRRTSFKEIVLPYTAEEAKEESSRCLRCDL